MAKKDDSYTEYKEVQHVRLTTAQESFCLAVLVPANRLLHKWAEYWHSKKFREFRNKVLAENPAEAKNPFGCIPADELGQFQKDVAVIRSIRYNRHKDLGDRSIEEALLSSYAPLAKRHAAQWAQDERRRSSFNDYRQEAYMKVIDAIYGFTRDDICFSTFLWVSLKNRRINVMNAENILCPLTNADLELLTIYKDAQATFNRPYNYDDVVDVMRKVWHCTDEQIGELHKLTAIVLSEGQFGGKPGDGDDDDDSDVDITYFRKNVNEPTDLDRHNQEADIDVIFRKAGLNEIEEICLRGEMDEGHGSQAKIARTHMNPNTGRPYTRQRLGQILERAKEKVRRVLEAEAEAA